MNLKSFIDHGQSSGIFVILITFLSIYVIIRLMFEDSRDELAQHLHKYVTYEDNYELDEAQQIDKLKPLLEKLNSKQNIRNEDRYGPVVMETPILVIQVHKDINRLQCLIVSLAQVQGIHGSILIFSHSFFHESINNLVRSVDFCKVMQIFYPFSLQLNPHTFPGVDPDDCDPEKPSPYCLKRDARLTEHKQHWWWKANYIFHRISCTREHKNPVIFLEEDNYAAPDLMHMYQYLQRSFNYFPYVEVLSFGRPVTREINMDLLTVEPWRPPFDIGLAFNKTAWNKILSLSAQFCMYDDYSWSYSLLHLFESFPGGHVDMAACMNPRIISTRECKNTKEILKFSLFLNSLDLFPKKVKGVTLFGPQGRVEWVVQGPPTGKGGWSDLRDQLLCLDPLMVTTTEEKRYDESKV